MELHTRKLMLWNLSVLVHLQDVLPLSLCLKGEWPHQGTHIFWSQSGDMDEEGPTT